MSYDALVWLLVGLGIGVAGSLVLLVGYVTLEHQRLGRRLRRARGDAAATVPPTVSTLPPPPLRAKRPDGRAEAAAAPKPQARLAVVAKPAPADAPAVKPGPVRPVLAVPALPRPGLASRSEPPSEPAKPATIKPDAEVGAGTKPEPEAKPGPALSLVAATPSKPAVPSEPAALAGAAASPTPTPPKPLQSVEAMFAEAFANDRLTVSPEPAPVSKPPKP